MKRALIFSIIAIPMIQLAAQNDTVRYLFMGHPRDDDRAHEHVLKTVEKLDYSRYALLLLGGDLTWNTSELISTLEYCDNIFHLSDTNTHLALGNHDLDNSGSLFAYTQKDRYYAFSRNNITFLVLDTEITTPNIVGEQLNLIDTVTDTIVNSDYLVLIHHRILWMAGNDDLAHLKDSVAASSRNLSQSNFFDEVYPLLRRAKQKGIEVLCMAGDRTDINISYSVEDSIQLLASGMVGTFPDTNNYAILLTHDISNHKLNYDFVPLSELDTIESGPITHSDRWEKNKFDINIYPNPCSDFIHLNLKDEYTGDLYIQIFSLTGTKVYEAKIPSANKTCSIPTAHLNKGIYLVKVNSLHSSISKKFLKSIK
jgi:hypothetical protein